MGLQLRNKTPKRRVKAKLRDDRQDTSRPHEIWAMDFVHDQLATGRRLRILTVVDLFSRFPPAIDPQFSYRAENVVETLEQVCAVLGYPGAIRVDEYGSAHEWTEPVLDVMGHADRIARYVKTSLAEHGHIAGRSTFSLNPPGH